MVKFSSKTQPGFPLSEDTFAFKTLNRSFLNSNHAPGLGLKA